MCVTVKVKEEHLRKMEITEKDQKPVLMPL